MKKAEYPQRSCRQHVNDPRGIQDGLCEIFDLHAGPCATFSIPASVAARDNWEKENPGWERQLAEGFGDPFS